MAEVLPFQGVRFNTDRITDPENVIAPPYDVIYEVDRIALEKQHPNNIVRLILSLLIKIRTRIINIRVRPVAYVSGYKMVFCYKTLNHVTTFTIKALSHLMEKTIFVERLWPWANYISLLTA